MDVLFYFKILIKCAINKSLIFCVNGRNAGAYSMFFSTHVDNFYSSDPGPNAKKYQETMW